jgi:MFS superfamily sulfate permease-like transporter
MKLTQRAINTYGWIAILLMVFMAVLIFFQKVPVEWYRPMLGIAVALFLGRITLRLILARQKRLEADAPRDQRPGRPPR